MGSLTFSADSIPDLQQKVFIVTGGNSGLVGRGARKEGCATSHSIFAWELVQSTLCVCFSCAPPCLQGYETALQLALHNGRVIVATHAQDPNAPMPADEIDGPG